MTAAIQNPRNDVTGRKTPSRKFESTLASDSRDPVTFTATRLRADMVAQKGPAIYTVAPSFTGVINSGRNGRKTHKMLRVHAGVRPSPGSEITGCPRVLHQDIGGRNEIALPSTREPDLRGDLPDRRRQIVAARDGGNDGL
jgi:hypothetical protein